MGLEVEGDDLRGFLDGRVKVGKKWAFGFFFCANCWWDKKFPAKIS